MPPLSQIEQRLGALAQNAVSRSGEEQRSSAVKKMEFARARNRPKKRYPVQKDIKEGRVRPKARSA